MIINIHLFSELETFDPNGSSCFKFTHGICQSQSILGVATAQRHHRGRQDPPHTIAFSSTLLSFSYMFIYVTPIIDRLLYNSFMSLCNAIVK